MQENTQRVRLKTPANPTPYGTLADSYLERACNRKVNATPVYHANPGPDPALPTDHTLSRNAGIMLRLGNDDPEVTIRFTGVERQRSHRAASMAGSL